MWRKYVLYRVPFWLNVKLKVFNRFDSGEHSVDIQREMGLHDSPVRTIRDNCDKIHKSTQTTTNLSVTRTARSRPDAIEKMVKMLTTWILDRASEPTEHALVWNGHSREGEAFVWLSNQRYQ